eukprot:m.24442 g.24442  ORF g.24442 m.24442 type:complete len:80 (-) comp8593_c0_seq1:695-934(-)
MQPLNHYRLQTPGLSHVLLHLPPLFRKDQIHKHSVWRPSSKLVSNTSTSHNTAHNTTRQAYTFNLNNAGQQYTSREATW